jgi:hypothetical protein
MNNKKMKTPKNNDKGTLDVNKKEDSFDSYGDDDLESEEEEEAKAELNTSDVYQDD